MTLPSVSPAVALEVLDRCHPGPGPASGRARRVEFEYERGGTLCYLGAYDVHAARLFGHVAPTGGLVPLILLRDARVTARRAAGRLDVSRA